MDGSLLPAFEALSPAAAGPVKPRRSPYEGLDPTASGRKPGFSSPGRPKLRVQRITSGTPYFETILALWQDCAHASSARRRSGDRLRSRTRVCAAPGFTDRRFNTRAVGLAQPKPSAADWFVEKSASDPWHMNAAFGHLRLADIAAALAPAPAVA